MLAEKTPMGWNSWNTFGKDINEQLIMEMADVIVEKGYKDAGYEYVIIAVRKNSIDIYILVNYHN